jgi:type IV secretory pathway VirB4 component
MPSRKTLGSNLGQAGGMMAALGFQRPTAAPAGDAVEEKRPAPPPPPLPAARAVSAPALSYLFTSFERLLHEAPAKGPTLILVDEAWTALAGGPFADFVENALRTFRKLNAGVVLATQSPADLRGSRLWNILVESCPTRIILPGSHAVTTSADLLADLGLTETERQLVAQATPRLEYFVSSPSGSRLFRLGLSDLERAIFTTPPGVSLHQTIELALSCQRQDPEGWLSIYLSRRKELHGL